MNGPMEMRTHSLCGTRVLSPSVQRDAPGGRCAKVFGRVWSGKELSLGRMGKREGITGHGAHSFPEISKIMWAVVGDEVVQRRLSKYGSDPFVGVWQSEPVQ